MSTGLQRDAIVILRMDGEDLFDFINGPSYEPEMISIFSQIDMVNEFTVSENISKALQLLSVDHGMPPLSDSWVMSNIVEPALQSCMELDVEQTMTQEILLEEFKKVAEKLVQLLKATPVIVAHNEQIFDGSSIRRLISSKFEFNKALEVAMKDLHKDDNGKVPKESLRGVLDLVGPATGLPSTGAIDQMDTMLKEAIETKIVEGESGKMIEKEQLKKLVTEVLDIVMLKLEESPLTISSNSVLHEPLSTSSDPSIT